MPNHFRSQKFTVLVLVLLVLILLIALGGPPSAIDHLSFGIAITLPVVVGAKGAEDWARARAAGRPPPPSTYSVPTWPPPRDPPPVPGSRPSRRDDGGTSYEAPTGWGGG